MSDRCPTCGGRRVTWPPERIIEAAKAWAEKHGGVAPSFLDWKDSAPDRPSHTGVIRQFGSWNAMIVAAGFQPRKQGGNRKWTREAATLTLFPWVLEHGRLPKSREWRSPADGRPTTTQMVAMFGSWNSFLVACGYEPTKAYRSNRSYSNQAGMALRLAPDEL